MDAFENDELYQIRSFFYQGNYEGVVNEPVHSLSRTDLAQLYQYRSRIELGQASQVAEEMGAAGSTGGGFEAVKAYAEYRSGDKKRAVEDMLELVEADPEDDVVQVIGATVLCLEGRTDEALDLLSKHENNLEAVAIIIQIRLAHQHNHEAAERELNAAKSWAQDSLLAQVAEAWLSLAKGGEGSQGAFYIYEELAQSSTATAKSLLGQAVSEIQLGRLPEAESTLKQALDKDPQNPDVLANAVVCATLSGKDYSVYLKYIALSYLKAHACSTLTGQEHQLISDLKEKSVLFDQLSANYAVSAAA